jgi:hypothetical protein
MVCHLDLRKMTSRSGSALDMATTDCFLLHHVTKLPSTNVQYSDVNRRCIIDPAQCWRSNQFQSRASCLEAGTVSRPN